MSLRLSDRDACCSVRVAVLLGSGHALTAGPAHVEFVASAEPNEMATDDVLQVREIVLISPDRQVECIRRARQLSASVRELDPAASVAVGPLASITATEMRDELLPVTRRSISDYQGFASIGFQPCLLVSLPLMGTRRLALLRRIDAVGFELSYRCSLSHPVL